MGDFEKKEERVIDDSKFHPANVEFLNEFIGSSGRIMPRRKTGLSERQQRMLSKAVKKARVMGLMSFTAKLSKKDVNEILNERSLIGYDRVIEKRPVGLPVHTKVPVE